jgi:hypothetical protein
MTSDMSDKVMTLYLRTVCIFFSVAVRTSNYTYSVLSVLLTYDYFRHFCHELLEKFMSLFITTILYEA